MRNSCEKRVTIFHLIRFFFRILTLTFRMLADAVQYLKLFRNIILKSGGLI